MYMYLLHIYVYKHRLVFLSSLYRQRNIVLEHLGNMILIIETSSRGRILNYVVLVPKRKKKMCLHSLIIAKGVRCHKQTTWKGID